MKIFRFQESYSRYFRFAILWQIAGILLASTVLDGGGCMVYFLSCSLIYWILAPLYSLYRKNPTKLELRFIASGPLGLFIILLLLLSGCFWIFETIKHH